jgi:hypothetical protein
MHRARATAALPPTSTNTVDTLISVGNLKKDKGALVLFHAQLGPFQVTMARFYGVRLVDTGCFECMYHFLSNITRMYLGLPVFCVHVPGSTVAQIDRLGGARGACGRVRACIRCARWWAPAPTRIHAVSTPSATRSSFLLLNLRLRALPLHAFSRSLSCLFCEILLFIFSV